MNPAERERAWEEAYLRFETPEEETRKFLGRLRRLGAGGWPVESRVVELFCGRGTGLHALAQAGFRSVAGVDSSLSLLSTSRRAGQLITADCRELPIAGESCDIAIVQGGLHHLPRLPGDLDRTLAEARRILKPGGRFVAVEPWMSPFLRLVHALCRQSWLRRISRRVDALAAMIDHERETYDRWLGARSLILDCFRASFRTEICRVRWGKLFFAGRR